jgi:ABC-type multidrug transport system ATPase subunit
VDTIRYGPFARLADWWHGWRDGLANIPERPPRQAGPPPDGPPPRRDVTTPHREFLIRMAQDAFDHERVRMESGLVAAGRRLAGTRTRAEKAREALVRLDAERAGASRPLTEAEATHRRVAEGRRTDTIVRARRERERARRIAPVERRYHLAEQELDAAEIEFAAAADEADRHRAVARARVDRIHQHAQRRIAGYRRRLVLSHPEGPWLNRVLGVLDPHLPGWITEGAETEYRTTPRALPPVEPPTEPSVPPLPWRHELGDLTVFGADPGVDVVVDYYYAARRHFALRRDGEVYKLVDYGHGYGPFIDGKPIRRAWLGPGDGFDFGGFRYRIDDGGRFLLRTSLDPNQLIVHRLSVTTGDVVRISEMSLVQPPSTVLAVLGPSGAGKTSLFYALMRELKPNPGAGEFYYGDLNLREDGAEMRTKLGFVPQDDHLHRTLTVEKLLRYSDRLRRPTGRRDREARIADICRQLQLDTRRKRLVGTLSGGQRKRVSIALELLARPPLLMLDEPTSGLDAGMDREVMDRLQRYAEDGHLVIVITHTIQHLDRAQQILILATEGRPIYLGVPADVLTDLGTDSYASLMAMLSSDEHREHVTDLATAYAEGPIALLAENEARARSRPAAARLGSGRPPASSGANFRCWSRGSSR